MLWEKQKTLVLEDKLFRAPVSLIPAVKRLVLHLRTPEATGPQKGVAFFSPIPYSGVYVLSIAY